MAVLCTAVRKDSAQFGGTRAEPILESESSVGGAWFLAYFFEEPELESYFEVLGQADCWNQGQQEPGILTILEELVSETQLYYEGSTQA